MLKLNTHIPLDVVKKSKELQNVECMYYYFHDDICHIDVVNGDYYGRSGAIYNEKMVKTLGSFQAPTIADCIDSAKELFGEEYICSDCGDIPRWCMGEKKCGCYGIDEEEYCYVVKEIISMCQQNKTIQEISEYILKNIKS